MCYLIFCRMFNIPFGLNKYINQAAIETEPVIIKGRNIAFQAKFYSGKLQDKKKELISIITQSSELGINKLLIFTNLSWGQNNRGRESRAKVEIESHAQSKEIDLEWFTESRFDALSADPVIQSFFEVQAGVKDEIYSWLKHTQAQIQSKSNVPVINGLSLVYNRQQEIQAILQAEHSCTLVYGESGVGKSYMLNMLPKTDENITLLIKDAHELTNCHRLNELFQHCSAEDFFDYLNHVDGRKYFAIDTAEHLTDTNCHALLHELMAILQKYSWNLILCCRPHAAEAMKSSLSKDTSINEVIIQPIPQRKLTIWSTENNFCLPREEKLLNLVQRPIYLREFLLLPHDNCSTDEHSFYDSIWRNITNNRPDVDEALRQLAVRHAKSGTYYLNTDDFSNLSFSLLEKNILSQEGRYYYFTHDLYEELAIFMHIDHEWTTKGSPNIMDLFSNLETSALAMRALRKWLTWKMESDSSIYQPIARAVISNETENSSTQALLTSIIQSTRFEEFLREYSEILWSGNHEKIHAIIHLIRLYSKKVNTPCDTQQNGELKSSIMPYGNEWVTILNAILSFKGTFIRNDFDFISNLLFDLLATQKKNFFSSCSHMEFRTRLAQCAMKIYREAKLCNRYFFHGHTKQTLTCIISINIDVLLHNLEQIINDIPLHNPHQSPFYDLLQESAMKHPYTAFWAKEAPHLLYRIMPIMWKETSTESNSASYYHDIESTYGLKSDIKLNYLDPDSFSTPIYYLLKHDFAKAIDFTLDFINESVVYFSNNPRAYYKPNKLAWKTRENKESYLYCSSSLWNMYRGTSSPCVPYLLTSIHMAMERALCELVEGMLKSDSSQNNKLVLNLILHAILDKAHSISIVSVVSAIVREFPSVFPDVALRIFTLKEVFMFDRQRKFQESTNTVDVNSSQNTLLDEFFPHTNDRITAQKRRSRLISLEELAIDYQFNIRCDRPTEQIKKEIIDILETHYAAIKENEDEANLLTLLRHIDSRLLHICYDAKSKHSFILPIEFETFDDWIKKTEDFNNELYFNNPLFIHMRICMKLTSDKAKHLSPIPLEQLIRQLNTDSHTPDEQPPFSENWNEYNCCIILYILITYGKENEYCDIDLYYDYLISTLLEHNDDILTYSYLEAFLNQIDHILIAFPQSLVDLPPILAKKLHSHAPYHNKYLLWSKSLSKSQKVNEQFPSRVISNYLQICTQNARSDDSNDLEKLQHITTDELTTLIKAIPTDSQQHEINKLMIRAISILISPSNKISYDIHSASGYYFENCPVSYAIELIQLLMKNSQVEWLHTILRFFFTPKNDGNKFDAIWKAITSNILQIELENNKLPKDYSDKILPSLLMYSVDLTPENEEVICKLLKTNSNDVSSLIEYSCEADHCMPALTRLLNQYPSLIQHGIEWIYLAFNVHNTQLSILKNTTTLQQLESIVKTYNQLNYNNIKTNNFERRKLLNLLNEMVHIGSVRARMMLENEI